MADGEKSEGVGCLCVVLVIGLLASGLVYLVLARLGVEIPAWVLWADAVTFVVLLVLAGFLHLAARPPDDP